MKITDIVITMEYNEREKADGKPGPVILTRNNKCWTAIEGIYPRGMFPHEIRLINMLQEDIIKNWNAQDKE